jgi:protein-disulfide isomerase
MNIISKKDRGFINLPTAIVISATIIAIAIIWVNKPANTNVVDNTKKDTSESAPIVNIRPITKTDYILGNPNAPIIMLEYSDPSCPFCKSFDATMEKVVAKYVESGKVAWTYRHYPLDFHPNAVKESEAIECAGEQGGNQGYWKYLRKLYEVTPAVTQLTPNGLDQKELPNIAKEVGLDVETFKTCLSSGKFNTKVKADLQDGINAGIRGTPHTIFVMIDPIDTDVEKAVSNLISQLGITKDMLYISKDKTKIGMSGALPFEAVEYLIEAILK